MFFRLNNLQPKDGELWVKFGGDKGGGSTKFELQICNVEKPNAVNNIILLLIFDGPDNQFNIERTLPDIAFQVQALDGALWK